MFEKPDLPGAIAYSQLLVTSLPTIANSPIAYSASNEKISTKQADAIIASVTDLITDPAYKPFFFKRLYNMGPTRFMELADRARKGKKPAALFTTLIKDYS